MSLPPEDHAKKMVPILSRVVGVAFILGGIIGLAMVPVLYFTNGDSTLLFTLVFLGGSVLNLALGFVVIKYVPAFMLSLLRKLRDYPPFWGHR